MKRQFSFHSVDDLSKGRAKPIGHISPIMGRPGWVRVKTKVDQWSERKASPQERARFNMDVLEGRRKKMAAMPNRGAAMPQSTTLSGGGGGGWVKLIEKHKEKLKALKPGALVVLEKRAPVVNLGQGEDKEAAGGELVRYYGQIIDYNDFKMAAFEKLDAIKEKREFRQALEESVADFDGAEDAVNKAIDEMMESLQKPEQVREHFEPLVVDGEVLNSVFRYKGAIKENSDFVYIGMLVYDAEVVEDGYGEVDKKRKPKRAKTAAKQRIRQILHLDEYKTHKLGAGELYKLEVRGNPVQKSFAFR